ncbi:MAG TPA: GAF domain-containing protein [Blastococcus sp.]|jgi:signal transduction histidine kinase|nr:GAF domain-containing protein [Blastococcus sp.]
MATEPADNPAHLSFPDLPRLELDQLLGQLVERAQEVMGTQGRLRSLLKANRMIGGDLEVPAVLRHAVAAARELVGAEFAAIGVLGPTGGLSEFIHDGMDPDTVARLGLLPQGKGLLGAVIERPAPLRLRHLSDDPRSAGPPPGHPPMDGFLGVPIRVRDDVFGAFYLVNSTRGSEFTAEDEELLGALAATVGGAVDNARLYEAARSRGEWLSASAAVTRQLLSGESGDDTDALRLIAERTVDIARADLVLVLRPPGREAAPSELTIEVSVGADSAHLRGRTVPVENSVSGRVFLTAEPALLAHLTDGAGLSAITSGEVELGPLMAVPLLGSDRVHGVLTAARLNGRPGFTHADLDMAGSFANHAALAIELADARAEQQRSLLLDERERIAADLHDHVIQRMFGDGLALQGLLAKVGPGAVADRIRSVVQDLDENIRLIRSTVFQLRHDPAVPGDGARARLLEVLADFRPVLGFDPDLRFSGLRVDGVPAAVIDDLLAVLREALTNVARHAGARSAGVEVLDEDGRLTLRVTDDGCGAGDTLAGGGLADMRRRAERHDGECTLDAAAAGGTTLSWSVPLARR